MIIVVAFLALMLGFLFGYINAVLLNFSSKEYDEPTQPTVPTLKTEENSESKKRI